MLLQNKHIAIVGAGPAGLTLARLLQCQGCEVKVYERDLNQNARVQGSPLDLHEGTGMAAIIKAGLLEPFKQNFMPRADRTKILNAQAEVFYSEHETQPTCDFDHKNFRPEIDRGVLRKIILDALHPNTVQ